MEAKELRIGNWISRNGNQYVATKTTIYAFNDEHDPIELTEEWLERFGFRRMTTQPNLMLRPVGGKFNLDSKDIIIGLEDRFLRIDVGDFVIPIGEQILYVHQLQNLYFALTGEELEINK